MNTYFQHNFIHAYVIKLDAFLDVFKVNIKSNFKIISDSP